MRTTTSVKTPCPSGSCRFQAAGSWKRWTGIASRWGPESLSFGGDQGCRRTEGRLGHRSGALDDQPAMLMLIQLERIPPEMAGAP